jgi:nitroreductase
MENEVLSAIRQRRSVRKFTDEPITDEELDAILEAGRWAPSGLNNQPWRFAIVRDQAKKNEVAGQTNYGKVVSQAPVLVAVFLAEADRYHEIKDAQAVGACLQNMLLASHSLGLGAVWLGEILKNADAVRQILGLGPDMELQAVVAVGRPKAGIEKSSRRRLEELIVGRF